MNASPPSLTRRLACRLRQPVDAAARTRARLHLVDWLACVAGARHSPVADAARLGDPDSLVRAAFGGNVLEMDDVDRRGRLHPGPVVWPAALSAIRETGGSLGDLLDGAVRGYEAMICVGRAFDDRHYAFWHNTATAGSFGAVAAAGSIYRLGEEALADGLGNAGSVAGGLWQMRHEPVMTKSLHVAHVARSGAWIARLARAGFTGPSRILEGEQGLFAATTDAARLDDFAGDGPWRIAEVSFKPYGACRHAHPAIDAAIELRALLSDGPIRIETYRDALVFCDKPAPETPIEAKFSLQHAVAVVATRGIPTLADFEPAAIADKTIAAIRQRISVAEAPDLTAAYPVHFGARIIAGGRQVTAVDALGDPERPIGETQIVGKLRELIAWGGLPEHEAAAAVDVALQGDETRDVHSLLTLVERWTA